ncbi:class A beta-lactamase [Herbaspirillum sp. meg3]|jgi:beta-lactamase class A|uniref:class A beta-lactamase n=1 Tax=Herbaspirillum sp. meg3 TaxID=2025949 RepID=UPI000B97E31F|nr:class A beta-lactamase [Herbaspirillum sp. meg3]ASU38141.1 class A beta-lactamase [Herbaspirillum sp. meg3]
MIARRQFLTLAGLALSGTATGVFAAGNKELKKSMGSSSIVSQLAKLEASVGGRLGVDIIDSATQRRWGYRADERFPMCSTFKFLASAAVLKRVDAGQEQLDRRIIYGNDVLVSYSPTTSKHVGGDGLTLGQLCEAALTLSDNTAANLILKSLGGLEPFNKFIKSLGDKQTRLDRFETELNTAIPGDPRDTTTPAAMSDNLQHVLLGDVLSPSSRAQLIAWMRSNKTGDRRVRAGMQHGWTVGDKTGSGDYGTTNTIAIIWPPQGKPLLASIYLTRTKAPEDQRNAVLAEVGKIIVGLDR